MNNQERNSVANLEPGNRPKTNEVRYRRQKSRGIIEVLLATSAAARVLLGSGSFDFERNIADLIIKLWKKISLMAKYKSGVAFYRSTVDIVTGWFSININEMRIRKLNSKSSIKGEPLLRRSWRTE